MCYGVSNQRFIFVLNHTWEALYLFQCKLSFDCDASQEHEIHMFKMLYKLLVWLDYLGFRFCSRL